MSRPRLKSDLASRIAATLLCVVRILWASTLHWSSRRWLGLGSWIVKTFSNGHRFDHRSFSLLVFLLLTDLAANVSTFMSH